jgi:hypothetical protein
MHVEPQKPRSRICLTSFEPTMKRPFSAHVTASASDSASMM